MVEETNQPSWNKPAYRTANIPTQIIWSLMSLISTFIAIFALCKIFKIVK